MDVNKDMKCAAACGVAPAAQDNQSLPPKLFGMFKDNFMNIAMVEAAHRSDGCAQLVALEEWFDKTLARVTAPALQDVAGEPVRGGAAPVATLPERLTLIGNTTLTGFNLKALMGRLNAVWFDGEINEEQRKTVAAFASVYLLYTKVLGRGVPVSWLAYVMATAYHETAGTMEPIEEYGHGKGKEYGNPDKETGETYYGRGYVQITWKKNYTRAQGVVVNPETLSKDVPFVEEPGYALVPFFAAQIALGGMVHGWFTGRNLADYLTSEKTDYVNARRIINGTDKAQLIAGYAGEVEAAIRFALGHHIQRDTVKKGSYGDDVRELQLMLEIGPDALLGDETEKAIRSFQGVYGLSVDGICGAETWAALDEFVYSIPRPCVAQ
ncbi:peptidoglycan-binding protein [Buttiauxella brennerae]|uniref:peptidoglycan-binding protein n=1 Tax=Buttiauxella brennerae TaxID=82988 RepID=UPI00286ED69D|nr:peptidoglycan-binding protein [Buttiauxella brennerae]